jgi:hypothetical protein
MPFWKNARYVRQNARRGDALDAQRVGDVAHNATVRRNRVEAQDNRHNHQNEYALSHVFGLCPSQK